MLGHCKERVRFGQNVAHSGRVGLSCSCSSTVKVKEKNSTSISRTPSSLGQGAEHLAGCGGRGYLKEIDSQYH